MGDYGAELKILHGAGRALRAHKDKKLAVKAHEAALEAEHTGPCVSRKDLIEEYEKRLQRKRSRK